MLLFKHPLLFLELNIRFYDDDENHTFGTLKKKQKRPLSNFTFKLVKKIVASHSSSTGFLVEVIPETVGDDSSSSSESEDSTSSRYVNLNVLPSNIYCKADLACHQGVWFISPCYLMHVVKHWGCNTSYTVVSIFHKLVLRLNP